MIKPVANKRKKERNYRAKICMVSLLHRATINNGNAERSASVSGSRYVSVSDDVICLLEKWVVG